VVWQVALPESILAIGYDSLGAMAMHSGQNDQLEAGPDAPQLNPLSLLLFILLAAIFVLTRLNSLFVGSIDFGHHVVLVTRLMEHLGGGLDPNDASTGAMAVYPRYAHALAAVVGTLVDSPVLGVHFISLVAVLAAWSAWALAARSLPEPAGVMNCLWLLILMLIADRFIRLEVFGNEILVNFFYAQMVGQAFACAVIAIATGLDARGGSPVVRYAVLGGAAWLLTKVHLVPAVQIFGFLVLMVITDALAARGRSAWNHAAGVAAIVIALALIFANPQVWELVRLSEHDGGLFLRYTPEPVHVAILAAVVAAVAVVMLLAWSFLSPDERRKWAYGRAVALFALTVSGLGIAQFLALKLGYGSPYSVKKHAFALNAAILLLLAFGLARFTPWAKARRHWIPPLRSVPAWATACLVPLALLGARSFEPRHASIETSRLAGVERFARHAEGLTVGDPSPQHDYAIGISGIGPIGDYLVSIASLQAPIDDNADAIRRGLPPPHQDLARYILTSTGRAFWDVPACRRTPPALGLIFVDAHCVLAEAVPPCAGKLDLTGSGEASPYAFDGLSAPESIGRWSDGGEASFTCRVRAGASAPRLIRFATRAFLPPGRSQRLIAGVGGGGEPATYVYDAATSTREIALPISAPTVASGIVKVTFRFPDAVSPAEAGVGRDTRRLAIAFTGVVFEVGP
jgi:hypothetical protein